MLAWPRASSSHRGPALTPRWALTPCRYHSPISIWNYIHQDVEMPWVPELVCQLTHFLADGTPMPTAGTFTTPEGDEEDKCFTECGTEGACDYDCETDSFLTCPTGP